MRLFRNIENCIITTVCSCDHPYDFLFIKDAVRQMKFFAEQDFAPGACNVCSGKASKPGIYLQDINEFLGVEAISFNPEKDDGLYWSKSWFDASTLDFRSEPIKYKILVFKIFEGM